MKDTKVKRIRQKIAMLRQQFLQGDTDVFAQPVVSHHSLPRCVVLMGGVDQTTVRSAGENHLSASAPTLELSEFPCNSTSTSIRH